MKTEPDTGEPSDPSDAFEAELRIKKQPVFGGRYTIVRRIAEGGMGIVYEARHRVLRRSFAIKVIRTQASADRQAVARFTREAQVVASLDNQHIAKVLDFDQFEGVPYMVMELLQGTDLQSLLNAEARLSVTRALMYAEQACEGLEHAHARGIIHRDIKPSNLFVCRVDEDRKLLKILDFGVARLKDSTCLATLDTASSLLGTLGYMAPEQIICASAVDLRADVYSLGVVLYRSLSGQMPHVGRTPSELLHQSLYERPQSLSATCPELPPRLTAVVHRALAHEPHARFSSTSQLAQALREALPSPSPPIADPSDAASRSPPSSKARRGWVFLAAACVGAGAAGGAAWVGGREALPGSAGPRDRPSDSASATLPNGGTTKRQSSASLDGGTAAIPRTRNAPPAPSPRRPGTAPRVARAQSAGDSADQLFARGPQAPLDPTNPYDGTDGLPDSGQ